MFIYSLSNCRKHDLRVLFNCFMDVNLFVVFSLVVVCLSLSLSCLLLIVNLSMNCLNCIYINRYFSKHYISFNRGTCSIIITHISCLVQVTFTIPFVKGKQNGIVRFFNVLSFFSLLLVIFCFFFYFNYDDIFICSSQS